MQKIERPYASTDRDIHLGRKFLLTGCVRARGSERYHSTSLIMPLINYLERNAMHRALTWTEMQKWILAQPTVLFGHAMVGKVGEIDLNPIV